MNRADRITPEDRERLLQAYAKLPRSPSGKRVENGQLEQLAAAFALPIKYLKTIIGDAKKAGHPAVKGCTPYATADRCFRARSKPDVI